MQSIGVYEPKNLNRRCKRRGHEWGKWLPIIEWQGKHRWCGRCEAHEIAEDEGIFTKEDIEKWCNFQMEAK